jgi:hypothetical protein
MISMFFLILGVLLGWWVRGTKAGSWISDVFSKGEKNV